jgi:hypothetical protein
MTNQKQVRASFWQTFPHFEEHAREAGILSKGQNHHCATVRCSFVDFVDSLQKSGEISEKLANRVTL